MSVADNMDRSPNSVSMLATDRPQSTPPYLDGGGGMDRLATADGRETFETRDHVQHFLDKPDDLKALNLLVPEHQRQMMEQVRKDMEVTQKKIDLAELAKKNGTERSEISAANGSVRQDTSQTNQLDMMASRPAVGTAGGSTKGGTRWSKDIRLSSSELNQTVNDAHAPKQTLSRRRSEVFATYSGDPSNHRVRKMQATSPPTKIRASRPYVSMSVPSSPYASQHNLDGDVATSSEHDTRFAMKAFGFPPFTSSLQPAAMTQQEQSPYHRPGHIRSASASAGELLYVRIAQPRLDCYFNMPIHDHPVGLWRNLNPLSSNTCISCVLHRRRNHWNNRFADKCCRDQWHIVANGFLLLLFSEGGHKNLVYCSFSSARVRACVRMGHRK